MTWNTGRKDWMGRGHTPQLPTERKALSSDPPDAPVVVPPIPAFSPACVAFVLNLPRQNVYAWMTRGRLVFYRDPIGEPYVLRDELIGFIEHYLHRPVRLPE
jgi:hypothetical protein